MTQDLYDRVIKIDSYHETEREALLRADEVLDEHANTVGGYPFVFVSQIHYQNGDK